MGHGADFFLFTFLISWMYNYILYMYIWFCADRKASRALLETTWQPRGRIHKEIEMEMEISGRSFHSLGLYFICIRRR